MAAKGSKSAAHDAIAAGGEAQALRRLESIVNPAIQEVLGSVDSSRVLSEDRTGLMNQIRDIARRQAADQVGGRLDDVDADEVGGGTPDQVAGDPIVVRAGFTDTTGDDLDIGILGGDDDWFGSGLDVNTNGTLLTLDDLTDTERYSASERTVTVNFTTAPTGDGTAGEAWIQVGYFVLE